MLQGLAAYTFLQQPRYTLVCSKGLAVYTEHPYNNHTALNTLFICSKA
jgi:hypothetical protein